MDSSDAELTSEGDFQVIPEPEELEKIEDFMDVFSTSPWLPGTISGEWREPASAKLAVGGLKAAARAASDRHARQPPPKLRGDVKTQQPRPSVCCSQSPPAATECLQHSYMEVFNYN